MEATFHREDSAFSPGFGPMAAVSSSGTTSTAAGSPPRGISPRKDPRPRGRFQFSLRGLLLFTAYVGVLLSILVPMIARRPCRATAVVQVGFPYRATSLDLARTMFEQSVKGPILNSEVLAGAAARPEIARLSVFPRQQSPTDWLAEHIEVRRVGDSQLVEVSLTARDPDDAAKIVNAVVESCLQSHESRDARMVRHVREALEEERQRRAVEWEGRREDVRKLAGRVSDRDSGQFLPESDAGVPTLADLLERLAWHEVERTILEAYLAALRAEMEGEVEADVGESLHQEAAAIQREIDACRTAESTLRRRCRERIEDAAEDEGALLGLELARAELARVQCVHDLVCSEIIRSRFRTGVGPIVVRQPATRPAPRVPIPYKTIVAISAVWLSLPLLGAGLWRVMRQRRFRS